MHKQYLFVLVSSLLLLGCGHRLKNGEYTLTILSTNDVHASWFDSTYVGGGIKKSLFAVNYYVDSVRTADGARNVLLVDAGDCLQGDNAAYYYNYVDTVTPHLFPRLVEYMHYDAIAWGNHDVETGHAVYDRVQRDLVKAGVPFLAANAIRNDNGKPYFPPYRMVEKAGLRVAVLGYENANIKAWLAEKVWSGMHFESVASQIQQDVDYVRKREQPDVVVAVIHSGTGKGQGNSREGESMDVFNSVKGVDWVICGHDHVPFTTDRDTVGFLNSGSHCRYVAEGKMHIKVEKGQVVSKTCETKLIPVDAAKADPVMREHFRQDFEAVKAFTLQEVGILNVDLYTRHAYTGMSPYTNLIHKICLEQAPAQLSIAAPLTYNGQVKTGTIIYNDLFTIYPFENQLMVITMTGDEIVRYLEASYDRWIRTISGPGQHVLRIIPKDNLRTQQKGWSFEGLPYNFDSIAGLNYTVDVTKHRGSRIKILSLADGSSFDTASTYNVALTSYRASGGGMLLNEIGIDTDHIGDRALAHYPEIRNILYDYIKENGSIDPEVIGDPKVIGSWKFVPENLAYPALEADMKLLFGE